MPPVKLKSSGYSNALKKIIDKVYRKLKAAGYDDYSIAGILGNAHTESSFDPDSASSSHYGLLQNSKEIRDAIIALYGNYNLDNQLRYILDWNDRADWVRKGNYAAHTALNAGKYKKTGYKSAQEAADAWMRQYERPVIIKDGKVVGYQAHNDRLKNSMNVLNYLLSTYGSKDGGYKAFPIDWSLVDTPQLTPPTLPKESPVLLENKPYLFLQVAVLMPKKDVYNAFDQAAVAYGNEQESPFKLRLRMPTLNDLMAMDSPDELLKRLIKEMLPMPNVQLKMPVFKNGKLPRYEDGDVPEGTNADASWHEDWLRNRQQLFDENYEGATEAELQRFADNNTSTVSGQLDNLRNTVEYSDLESFERALPENAEYFNPVFMDGAVRSAGSHNALWSKGVYNYGHDSTQHERTHALNPVHEDLDDYTGIENPQDSKINRIMNKYRDNLYYNGYESNEYEDTPEEIYAELNEFRKRAGLSPNYKVTIEDLQKWRDSLEDSDRLNVTLKRFADNVLLEFFNDVAYAGDYGSEDRLPMARNGKRPILKPIKLR